MRLFEFGEQYGPFECEVEERGNGKCGKETKTIRLSMFENNSLIYDCGELTGPKAANHVLRNAMGIAVCKKHIKA
jgi:hypothetical protein